MSTEQTTQEGMGSKSGNRSQPIIVGLDIGTTKVVAIAGRKNEFGKLEIVGFGRAESQGVSHGVVMNIEQCIRSIEKAIVNCLESNPELDIREVYVGIAGQHIKSMQTRGDRVRENGELTISKEDIDQLINDQRKTYLPAGDQIIDIVPQDFSVDNMNTTMSPIGMSGTKIGANFHIITGDKNAIKNILRCVTHAELKTKDLVLQPLASAAAVINEEDLEAGVAIVDIGGGTTDMAVFHDGILKHTAVIPYGGVNITNDIRNLGVLRAQAEAMKTQFGVALADEAKSSHYITIPGLRGLPAKEISVRNLAKIIQSRMEEILDYVVYNLKQIDLDQKLHGGIILTGGGALLKNIVQLTEFVTGYHTRIGYPNEHLAGGHSEELMNPMYSTCIGLILRGYHDLESGKHNFDSANGNSSIQKLTAPNEATPIENEEDAGEEELKQMQADKIDRRSEMMRSFFDRLKGKLMNLFENTEDNEL